MGQFFGQSVFFRTRDIIGLYKAQVLSFLESTTPAIFHAAHVHLNLLDRVQKRLLREVGVNEIDALCYYRLAPLEARRSIAMLGVPHRITLKIAPLQLEALFPSAPVCPASRTPTRLSTIRHSRQFVERFGHTDAFRRSLFGMVRVYNLLLHKIVEAPSVNIFQRLLQNGLRRAACSGMINWQSLFCPTSPPLHPASFQRILS